MKNNKWKCTLNFWGGIQSLIALITMYFGVTKHSLLLGVLALIIKDIKIEISKNY